MEERSEGILDPEATTTSCNGQLDTPIQTIVPSMIVTKHCSVLETCHPHWHGSEKKQKPDGPTENLAELVAS